MKALVTGGSGFIGSNIALMLVQKGYEVVVLDNLSSGHRCNLEVMIAAGQVRFIQGDIRDAEMVASACEGVDVVFHLAACVGRQKSIDDPVLDASTNVLGAVNVLEGMRKHHVPRIVYSSSAAIFGELLTPTIDENHPQNADSPYGVSKLAAEKMILAYAGIYDITGVCLRYFNIYGINQRFDMYGNVIPIFAKRIYASEPLTIYGDGTQTRDFVNVADVARANYLASLSELGMDVYNLGSGVSITIIDLAKKMMQISGRHVDILYAPERPADVKHCKANASKAEKCMQFKTEVSLDDGLRSYMMWYEKHCLG
jgi:nucleoside-diphosphate-sugar epimerase